MQSVTSIGTIRMQPVLRSLLFGVAGGAAGGRIPWCRDGMCDQCRASATSARCEQEDDGRKDDYVNRELEQSRVPHEPP